MKERRLPAAFKCYQNFHRANDVSPDNLFYKLVVHVHSDSGFRRYQKEMRLSFKSSSMSFCLIKLRKD